MARVIRIFLNTDMRLQHRGLIQTAGSKKVDIRNLGHGDHVVFVNKKMTRMKIFSENNLISYIFKQKGIALETIQEIANVFDGSSIDYTKALTAALRKKFDKNVYKT